MQMSPHHYSPTLNMFKFPLYQQHLPSNNHYRHLFHHIYKKKKSPPNLSHLLRRQCSRNFLSVTFRVCQVQARGERGRYRTMKKTVPSLSSDASVPGNSLLSSDADILMGRSRKQLLPTLTQFPV